MINCLSPCADPEMSGLLMAGMQTTRLAEEMMELSIATQARGQKVVDLVHEIQGAFSGLNRKLNAASFQAVMNTLNGDKMKDTIALAGEMDDLALDCVNKSTQMKETMMQGTRSLQATAKGDDSAYDTDSEEGDQELADLEADIIEIEQCNKDIHTMNLFSATTKGTRAFQALGDKGCVIQKTFGRIQELCASITMAAQTVVSENCCSQLKAGIDTIKAMLKSVRLSNLVTKLTEAAKRLIYAMKSLVLVAFEKFQDFAEQFQAGRKIKNWVHGFKEQGAKLLDNVQPGGNGRNTIGE